MQPPAHKHFCYLGLLLATFASSPVWAEDLSGNVTAIDTAKGSITVLTFTYGSAIISVKPDTHYWKVASDQTDLLQLAKNAESAEAIKFTDIAVGDRLLVRGQVKKGKPPELIAEILMDAGPSFLGHHWHRHDLLRIRLNGTMDPDKFGTFFLVDSSLKYVEPRSTDHNFTMSCEDFIRSTRVWKHELMYWIDVQHNGENFSIKLLDPGNGIPGGPPPEDVPVPPIVDKAFKAPCSKAVAELSASREKAAAADRAAAAAKSAVDFRTGILVALHAAEETDPFASIRGEFDLAGSDSHQWKTSLQLPDAEKCRLLKTAAATPTAASAWTFACIFRASGDGYERMVKSMQSVLNLPFQPDEKAVNMNQVFFADPTKPAWRFFAARMKDGTVGVSVVAVRFAGAPTTVANTTPFPAVPTMLPADPAMTNDPKCEEYQQQQKERLSREQEIRRLGAELQDLQKRYQEALGKALESEQLANNNTASGQKGAIAAINQTTSTIAGLTAQQSRSEAQALQAQINRKQSQITMAQTSASSLTVTPPPPGCTENRISQGTGMSVHEEVEKIRSGRYAPMPPAQRAPVGSAVVSGQVTMIVKNSTAYELSVFFDGPVSTQLTLMPGASQDLDLLPGTFHVASRVAAADVLPFYGDETYVDAARYSVTFNIAVEQCRTTYGA